MTTIVGGYRVLGDSGLRTRAKSKLYRSVCLKCGRGEKPRTMQAMAEGRGCRKCRDLERRAEHNPPESWAGWQERCDLVLAQLDGPRDPRAMLRLVRTVAVQWKERHIARQWLAAGESLGLWYWAAGFWWRTVQ